MREQRTEKQRTESRKSDGGEQRAHEQIEERSVQRIRELTSRWAEALTEENRGQKSPELKTTKQLSREHKS